MQSRRKSLINAKLYMILDAQVRSYDELIEITKKALEANVDIIQLRDKLGSAKDILDVSRRLKKIIGARALFIVNDRVDIAIASGASGVHLGQDDLPLNEARNLIGKNAIIGVSCQTFEQAKIAESNGADYLGFGSVFKTLTKPDRSPMDLGLLKKVVKKIKIPVFPIGGICLKNIRTLTSLGGKRAAVCREILLSTEIKRTVKDLSCALQL